VLLIDKEKNINTVSSVQSGAYFFTFRSFNIEWFVERAGENLLS